MNTETLTTEVNKLRDLALKNYDADEGEMYECSDEADYQAQVKKHGSADAAWAAHLGILPARREAGGYYENEANIRVEASEPAPALQAKSEPSATYDVWTEARPQTYSRPEIVAQALAAIEADMRQPGACFNSPRAVRDYILLHNNRHADQAIERFSVLYVDTQNRLIECVEMFTGTLTQTSVYPREIVRTALRLNAAACILTHNHPSGEVEPSRADELLTRTIKSTLTLVDVRVLDHFITGGTKIASMAEMGLV